MVDINIPKIVKSYVPLHRSTPLNSEIIMLFLLQKWMKITIKKTANK